MEYNIRRSSIVNPYLDTTYFSGIIHVEGYSDMGKAIWGITIAGAVLLAVGLAVPIDSLIIVGGFMLWVGMILIYIKFKHH